MFTSDTNLPKNNQLKKTAIVCLVLAGLCIVIDNIYALFGHGVRSADMSLMFLYPLIGGSLVYFLLNTFTPGIYRAQRFRLFFNLYNSGLAILTVGSLLQGILEIAGTESGYLTVYSVIGWGCTALGFLFYAATVFRPKS
ncbi:hypothetical protein LPY66_15460 [Dehalobacter sp. DCM]|uniref:hypothetical protein n=1 Tax=Dehalobacter sp. DCM TaxID=2907827 RepID=UPI00308184A8|nr:hypothetical protein LPY66_15460 [Dehalobacter sp. DCM]